LGMQPSDVTKGGGRGTRGVKGEGLLLYAPPQPQRLWHLSAAAKNQNEMQLKRGKRSKDVEKRKDPKPTAPRRNCRLHQSREGGETLSHISASK